MDTRHPDTLAQSCADALLSAFTAYHVLFKEYARRSKPRFEARDWAGIQRDARDRLDLYSRELRRVLEQVESLLGDRVRDDALWRVIKPAFARLARHRDDNELAETFFNSVTRRVFTTVGVNPEIEFLHTESRARDNGSRSALASYESSGSTREVLSRILTDVSFRSPLYDGERRLDIAATRIDQAVAEAGTGPLVGVDVLKPLFFRNKGAYIVARLRTTGSALPLVLPLLNDHRGVALDAVLIDRNDVSIVFSFTRSYFHVESERPCEIVAFLKSILPHKPIAELYTAIGYNKHGKTELFRDLIGHLRSSKEQFVLAPGTKGMVMSVFTLPSYDIVFKVIRDCFDFPKTATRAEVISRYNLVFKHDRVGRLVDTQEFEHLTFGRRQFGEDVVADLATTAPSAIAFDGDVVTLRHLFTERKLTPLNLYIRAVPLDAAREAVLDYGQAIKDLAAANIFPGDLLLKNFGVTRNGRVAFYDYDEVCLLTDCTFRRIPQARLDEDELSDEPWFAVRENDIFPEEFPRFLGLEGELRQTFERAHGDLFSIEFWQSMQNRLRTGEIADIFPYKPHVRLDHETRPADPRAAK